MTMTDFWKKWRAEIVRGAVIFTIVVAGGVFLVSAFNRAKTGLATGFRNAARNGGLAQLAQGLNHSFGGSFDDPGRTHGDAWNWHKKLTAGQQITIRNINGPVEVHPAQGLETVVETEKSWLGTDSAAVQVITNEGSNGVTICAVMTGSLGEQCGRGEHGTTTDRGGNPRVAVKFTVHVPSGVKVDVQTGMGDVDVDGGTADLTVHSGTGDISVTSMAWPVDLLSGTGDISATLRAPGKGDATVKSGIGDVSVSLPPQVNLSINAHTGVGDLSDDFGLPVAEAQYGPSKSLTGNLGSGGSVLSLTTGTGDIALNKAGAAKIAVVKVKNHGVTSVHVTPPPAPAPVVRP